MEEKLIATGIDVEGNEIEFPCNKYGWMYCHNNQLKKLTIPEGVTYISCINNQLKELIIPEGVTHIHCYNNQLTELTLPEGVNWLWADKEVMGLEKYMGTKLKIELR